ncbi:MAG TPA: hypothetical protein VMD53_11660 [Rhizomicrobium sp.]|nr:hypothetical protein [Rhizomicrobium sp.]
MDRSKTAPRLSLGKTLQYVTIRRALDLKLMSQQARHRRTSIVEAGLGFRPLMAFALAFAVFLQSYITQTHIHVASVEHAGVLHAEGDGFHHKPPIDDDSAHCPLCQMALMSGNFVAPVAPVLPVPLTAPVTAFVPSILVLREMYRAHGWQSRAPPRV